MSRIYNDKPLSNLTLITIEHSEWNVEEKSGGTGVLIEGNVCRRSKVSVNTKDGNKKRYFVLHVDVQKAHKRKFDSSGKEINPNFSETQKIGTGYLNKYKVEAKGETDNINKQEVRKLLQNDEMDQIYRKSSSLFSEGCLSFWLPESQLEDIEISDGDSLRITTKKNSPFIENLTKVEIASSTVSNFAGEQVGANWTDKIMSLKSNERETTPVDDNNDDEWDD
ncbi:Arpin [Mytilus coruscus]|uniref:Arpin n=1 Tax=Mytilus coruscus TaxID=42192 RepID=A0A6J8A816_MYTCO|nr:Arpin [Mytilus coruscus]